MLGLTPTGLVLLALAIAAFVGGRAAQRRGVLLASYGLLLLVGISWLLGRRRLSIDAQRSELPSRVRPGQVVEAQLSFTARQRLSTIVIEETLDEHLGASVRFPVPLLPAGRTVEHSYSFAPKVRGVYEVGPMIAEWSDPSGLTRRRQQIAPAQSVIVHPRVEPVLDRVLSRAWEDPPIRPPQLKPWPTGFEFYGLRDYVEGDDPRRIVWRAVAQYDRYLVRESEQGITDRVNLIMEADRELHSPGEVSETFETAVSSVASLARMHLRNGFGITIESNDGTIARDLRGGGKVIPLLDQLAQVRRSTQSLIETLDRMLASGARGVHNVVVTPELTPEVARRLRLMGDAGASMLVVLCIWDDTDPATLHRAGLLGCGVVEVHATMALRGAFDRVASGRLR
jgi:uncharacterized protein (DUF58 family)